MSTLAKLIKKKGYTQKFVHNELKKAGISSNYTHFNRWCNGFYAPKYEFIYIKLAEIISVKPEEIKACFNNKSNK